MSSREPFDQDEMDCLIDDLWSILFDTSLDNEMDGSLSEITSIRDEQCPDQHSISEDSTDRSGNSEVEWSNLTEKSLTVPVPPQEDPPVKICRQCNGLIALPILLPKTEDEGEHSLRVLFSSVSKIFTKPCETPACSCIHKTKNASRKGMNYKTKKKVAVKANQVRKISQTVKGTIQSLSRLLLYCVSHEQYLTKINRECLNLLSLRCLETVDSLSW